MSRFGKNGLLGPRGKYVNFSVLLWPLASYFHSVQLLKEYSELTRFIQRFESWLRVLGCFTKQRLSVKLAKFRNCPKGITLTYPHI